MLEGKCFNILHFYSSRRHRNQTLDDHPSIHIIDSYPSQSSLAQSKSKETKRNRYLNFGGLKNLI